MFVAIDGELYKQSLLLVGDAHELHPDPTTQGTPLGDPRWHLWAPCSPAVAGW
jgi:hypothetical protein